MLCCDKTGTLTKNEMTVAEIVTSDEQVVALPFHDLIASSQVCD